MRIRLNSAHVKNQADALAFYTGIPVSEWQPDANV